MDEKKAGETINQFFEMLTLEQTKHLRELLDEEVEFHVIGRPGVVPLAGVYRGRDEVLGYLSSFEAVNDVVDVIIQFHQHDVRESTRIASHINIVSDVRSTGRRYDLEFLYKWKLTDSLDKIRNMTLYYSTWHLTEAFNKDGSGPVVDQRGTNDFSFIGVDFDAASAGADLYDKFYVQGDVESAAKCLNHDVVLIEKGNPVLPSNGVYQGEEGFRQLIAGVFSYQIYISPPVFSNYITHGNKTDATLDVHFGDAVTGKDFTITLNQSLIFDGNGRLLELKSYHDSQEIWMNHLPG